MAMTPHDTHVAGGHARWAPPRDWRAKYGEAGRTDRTKLVAAARARLNGSDFSPSLEVEKEEVLALSGAPSVEEPIDVAPVRAVPETARPSEAVPGRKSWEGAARHRRGGSSAVERRRSTSEVARSTRAPRSRSHELVERDELIVLTDGELTPKQQAAQLGIKYGTLLAARQRLAKAGRIRIKHHATPHHPWPERDIAFLRENIGRLSFAELARALNRSEQAIELAAKRFKTTRVDRKRNRGSLNANDVAKLLGQDIHFVARELIPWGLLKAQRHPWLRANGADNRPTMQWAIRREDLVEFLLDYPWQYDRERIADPFFRRVADEAWKRDPLYTTTEVARILGFNGGAAEVRGQHGVSSFLKNTAPKIVPKDKLVIRRRGNPRASWSRSFAGMKCFIPRSTIRAIQASGWVNYRTVLEDPDRLTAEKAGALLYADSERPAYMTRRLLIQRARRFMASGAIPTKRIEFVGGRRPWMYATRDDVLALKPAFYMQEARVFEQRLSGPRRGLLQRHEPELLKRPRDLALQQATGELGHKLAQWWEWEQRAARDLQWRTTRKWALVTKHMARTLELLGPRTKIGGRRRLRQYHLGPCSPGLVEVPLALARRRGLECCEHCEFEAKFRRKRTGSIVPVVTCVVCRTTYRRGRGRPPKLPTCPSCLRERRAA